MTEVQCDECGLWYFEEYPNEPCPRCGVGRWDVTLVETVSWDLEPLKVET